MDKGRRVLKGLVVSLVLKVSKGRRVLKGLVVSLVLKVSKGRRVLKGQRVLVPKVPPGQHPPEAPEVPGRTPAARSRTKAGITTRVDSTVTHSNQQKKRFR